MTPEIGGGRRCTSDYDKSLMREMLLTYDGNQKRYAQIGRKACRKS